MTTSIGRVSCDLPSQGAMAHGLKPSLQSLENLFVCKGSALLAKAPAIAKGMFVDEAHQTEKFQQRVLQRRGGE